MAFRYPVVVVGVADRARWSAAVDVAQPFADPVAGLTAELETPDA
ncbi:hypothetical protein ACFPJ4_01490 [Lysinimonas soli]|uniref:Uncharacterized protein n=1 Tax=Lysinimonas soli TaxID=1074233 RepID=A0ABW0NLJ5_9MICO